MCCCREVEKAGEAETLWSAIKKHLILRESMQDLHTTSHHVDIQRIPLQIHSLRWLCSRHHFIPCLVRDQSYDVGVVTVTISRAELNLPNAVGLSC